MAANASARRRMPAVNATGCFRSRLNAPSQRPSVPRSDPRLVASVGTVTVGMAAEASLCAPLATLLTDYVPPFAIDALLGDPGIENRVDQIDDEIHDGDGDAEQ